MKVCDLNFRRPGTAVDRAARVRWRLACCLIGVGALLLTEFAAAQPQRAVAGAVVSDVLGILGRTGVRGAVRSGVVRSAVDSRAIARASRFCVRTPGQPACFFKNSRTAPAAVREAVKDVTGAETVVRQRSPSLFEVLDAANNVVSILEVLDRDSHPGFDDLPAWVPQEAGEANSYQVACGPGFAPQPYNNQPEHFGHWSCSNGGSYYNAAGACQPDKPGWRIWEVSGRRTTSGSSCP